jgi:uncharacterized protein (UPF0305 family)
MELQNINNLIVKVRRIGYTGEVSRLLINKIYRDMKMKKLEEITEEQMNGMSLDELQEIIETMNKGKQIDNQEFEAFQVLLLKDINITSDVNYKES